MAMFMIPALNGAGRGAIAPLPQGPQRAANSLPGRTGPLPKGGRALLIADVENLTLSARDVSQALHYDRLLGIVAGSFDTIEAHAFFSREVGDASWEDNLGRFGWITHPRDVITIRTVRGTERLSNSDNIIAFGAGMLATDTRFDIVLLGTGDGALGCDLAQAIHAVRKDAVAIHTLSFAGSTSNRLSSRANPRIASNAYVGRDCLSPFAKRIGKEHGKWAG